METLEDTHGKANEQTSIELYPHWRVIFLKYDEDGDERISCEELRNLVKNETQAKSLHPQVIRNMLNHADTNRDGYLDFQEFQKLVHSNQYRSLFGQMLNRYVKLTVPRDPRHSGRWDEPDLAGDYEREYSCMPPRVLMLLISVLEIITFVWDVATQGERFGQGPAAKIFIYDPHKRQEAWRFLTYMFVHVGEFHLVVNLVVQIMLGIPLEMVHGWWRVLLVYLAGVIAGSLGTSVSDPRVYLAGASGGVYAIIAAHIATIIMNWSEMQFAIWQLIIFVVLTAVDTGTAIYTRYVLEQDTAIGYAAHLAGALAGLLIGINVLRNLEVQSWERWLWWASILLFSVLMLAAVVWNIAYPSYFPTPRQR